MSLRTTISAPFRLAPTFLIIGTQKGGTTALWKYLLQHPEVGFASTKETDYFSWRYKLGPSWYLSHFPTVFSTVRRPFLHRAASRKIFPRSEVGEASPSYLLHPRAPERAYTFSPTLKLIALLRNPVERAYSGYQHAASKGYETLCFEDAIASEQDTAQAESDRLSREEYSDSYLLRKKAFLSFGHYAEHLSRWFEFFPREQVLVLESEAFRQEPARSVHTVLNFLDLPPLARASFSAAPSPQPTVLTDSTRERLIDYYRPHVQQLSQLLQQEFRWQEFR